MIVLIDLLRTELLIVDIWMLSFCARLISDSSASSSDPKGVFAADVDSKLVRGWTCGFTGFAGFWGDGSLKNCGPRFAE